MEQLKRNRWKMVAIVVVCLLVDMVLHLTIMPITYPTDVKLSSFVQNDIVGPVAGLALLLTFGALAIIFVGYQHRLPGKGIVKGWWYGLAFAVLWLIGFVEVSVLFDTSLADEFMNWLPDGISLILLSLLLGAFTTNDQQHTERNHSKPRTPILPIAAAFALGRTVAYLVFGTNTSYDPDLLPVFNWTVAMALWVGIMYAILRPNASTQSPLAQALWFGVLVLGTDWVLFNLFVLVFIDLPILDIVFRALLDLPFIIAGVFVTERWFLRRTKPTYDNSTHYYAGTSPAGDTA